MNHSVQSQSALRSHTCILTTKHVVVGYIGSLKIHVLYLCFECSLSYLDEIKGQENGFCTSTRWIQENCMKQNI